MVISILDSYNVCIFGYGQRQNSHYEGYNGNSGFNYRTLKALFIIAKETSETFTYGISVSVLEVYNEKIRDILAPPTTSKRWYRLQLILLLSWNMQLVENCLSASTMQESSMNTSCPYCIQGQNQLLGLQLKLLQRSFPEGNMMASR